MTPSPEVPEKSHQYKDVFPEDLRDVRDRLILELDEELAAKPFLKDDLYFRTLRDSVNDPDMIRYYVSTLEGLQNSER